MKLSPLMLSMLGSLFLASAAVAEESQSVPASGYAPISTEAAANSGIDSKSGDSATDKAKQQEEEKKKAEEEASNSGASGAASDSKG